MSIIAAAAQRRNGRLPGTLSAANIETVRECEGARNGEGKMSTKVFLMDDVLSKELVDLAVSYGVPKSMFYRVPDGFDFSQVDDHPSRTHPGMIRAAEELKSSKPDDYSRIRVVCLPDDVKGWSVDRDEYSGDEVIREDHRVWDGYESEREGGK